MSFEQINSWFLPQPLSVRMDIDCQGLFRCECVIILSAVPLCALFCLDINAYRSTRPKWLESQSIPAVPSSRDRCVGHNKGVNRCWVLLSCILPVQTMNPALAISPYLLGSDGLILARLTCPFNSATDAVTCHVFATREMRPIIHC